MMVVVVVLVIRLDLSWSGPFRAVVEQMAECGWSR